MIGILDRLRVGCEPFAVQVWRARAFEFGEALGYVNEYGFPWLCTLHTSTVMLLHPLLSFYTFLRFKKPS